LAGLAGTTTRSTLVERGAGREEGTVLWLIAVTDGVKGQGYEMFIDHQIHASLHSSIQPLDAVYVIGRVRFNIIMTFVLSVI